MFSMCIHTWWEGAKENGWSHDTFSGDQERGNEQKLKHRNLPLNFRKCFLTYVDD